MPESNLQIIGMISAKPFHVWGTGAGHNDESQKIFKEFAKGQASAAQRLIIDIPKGVMRTALGTISLSAAEIKWCLIQSGNAPSKLNDYAIELTKHFPCRPCWKIFARNPTDYSMDWSIVVLFLPSELFSATPKPVCKAVTNCQQILKKCVTILNEHAVVLRELCKTWARVVLSKTCLVISSMHCTDVTHLVYEHVPGYRTRFHLLHRNTVNNDPKKSLCEAERRQSESEPQSLIST